MHVWRLMAHDDPAKQDRTINWSRANCRIAIGWGRVGDLRDLHGPEEISRRIKQKYGDLHNAQLGGLSRWRFYDGMRINDLVIVNDSTRRPWRIVMRITGDYQFVTSPGIGGYRHQRPAEYVERDPNQLWTRPAAGENIRWTLLRCR